MQFPALEILAMAFERCLRGARCGVHFAARGAKRRNQTGAFSFHGARRPAKS